MFNVFHGFASYLPADSQKLMLQCSSLSPKITELREMARETEVNNLSSLTPVMQHTPKNDRIFTNSKMNTA